MKLVPAPSSVVKSRLPLIVLTLCFLVFSGFSTPAAAGVDTVACEGGHKRNRHVWRTVATHYSNVRENIYKNPISIDSPVIGYTRIGSATRTETRTQYHKGCVKYSVFTNGLRGRQKYHQYRTTINKHTASIYQVCAQLGMGPVKVKLKCKTVTDWGRWTPWYKVANTWRWGWRKF